MGVEDVDPLPAHEQDEAPPGPQIEGRGPFQPYESDPVPREVLDRRRAPGARLDLWSPASGAEDSLEAMGRQPLRELDRDTLCPPEGTNPIDQRQVAQLSPLAVTAHPLRLVFEPRMARQVLSFDLPLGSQFRDAEARGYPIDFRVKAQSSRWPPAWPARPSKLYVAIAQRGLGCYERYLAGEGDAWRDAAVGIAEWLVDRQQTGGRLDGAWPHTYTYPHTFPLPAPWVSAMAQGEGASLLVRMHHETDDDRFADAARRAVIPMGIPSREGGAMAELDGGTFLEEYPTDPPSCVLNGGIFAIWGCLDVAQELGDERARRLLEASVDTLAANLDRYDIGYWSQYDLFPHPVANVSSPAYHKLHIEQLKAMSLLTGRTEFELAVSRFERYLERPVNRARAWLGKGLFRFLIPTNRVLRGRFPWDRAIREPASKPLSEAIQLDADR